MNGAQQRTAKRFAAAAAAVLVWCAAFVVANNPAPTAKPEPSEAVSPAEGVATAGRSQHPAVSEDEQYYAEVMIYKGEGHEAWVGVKPGDKLVELTGTPGFDASTFSGLFKDACDPSQIDPRYTNAKYLSDKCDERRPGQERLERERTKALLGG